MEPTFKLLKAKKQFNNKIVESKLKPENAEKLFELSEYVMPEEAKPVYSMILKHFALGDTTMQTPRVEFNDLNVLQRDSADQMLWNTYAPNDGASPAGDELNSWRSNAIRPIVRNKCISIAAHATARLIFPKIFAYNNQSESQQLAARVMEDLMEWAADQSDYTHFSLLRVITSLYSVASIGHTEYTEAKRVVKKVKENGAYEEELIIDEVLSGFQNTIVPVQELYIENFYENDIQKQGWLIWRRVQSYSLLETKYANKYSNFKYVKPGAQMIYNDANSEFYYVYDPNMRSEDAEEVIYYNRTLDLQIIIVNGVMLTSHNNPNPRKDKLYPFEKFGYEPITNRCFYYKSLAFKLAPDARVINSLYSMVVDGTYLDLFPPMIGVGNEIIGSGVIVPGVVTTFNDPNSDIRPIRQQSNFTAGFNTMNKVEESINQSSEDPLQSGQQNPGSQTAYEISRLEANSATVLGLFIKMISQHVKKFGQLRLNDILQYLTIAEVSEIEGKDSALVYKTFFMGEKNTGKTKNRRIIFDGFLKSEMKEEEIMEESYDILEKEKEENTDEIYKVNPELFRNLKYIVSVTPDVLQPMSEDLERAYALETFDRAIALPNTDHDELTKTLLFGSSPSTRKNPDKYMAKKDDPLNMAQIGGTEKTEIKESINEKQGVLPIQKNSQQLTEQYV